ncbi:MAG TPA: HAD hydrolase family protein [Frankiaceae bacterium]|nr:HAD hydrolase family protein [Frankiaceae bacterium]
MRARVVYSDLDGTMVGPGGCFFRAEGGGPTLDPARALVALLASGVPLVLVSGRTRAQLLEACAVFGADGYVAELGALVGWDRGRRGELLRGAMPPEYDGVPDDLVEALLARHAGRLEHHAPWHVGHEVDVMLRGYVDVAEAEEWLAGQGFGWLRVRDNGVLPAERMPRLGGPPHVYHLVPDGVGKGLGVARDLQRRGLDRSEAVAVGDSASDLEMAPYVGRLHLVANGARAGHLAPLLAGYDNVVVEPGSFGAGWAAAVRAAIADGIADGHPAPAPGPAPALSPPRPA